MADREGNEQMDGEGTLSLVLFSGTDDKLAAAAVLTAGAAAMGRPVNVFLQYWALDAFRRDRIHSDHGAAAEAGRDGAELVRTSQQDGAHWSHVLAQAKEIGDVKVHACALSMELFELEQGELDPLVDDIEGVAAFMADAAGGPITFI